MTNYLHVHVDVEAEHVSVDDMPAVPEGQTTGSNTAVLGLATSIATDVSPVALSTVAEKPSARSWISDTRCFDMGTTLPASPKSHQPPGSSGSTVKC